MTLFVTFEGPDGSGKTTQIRLLSKALEDRGHAVLSTREPGGTRIGDAVRNLLLNPEHREMSARAEALLFNAARAQLVDEVILPALEAGTIVLCDRYGDSTLAYQGYGRGQEVAPLRRIVEFATGGLHPQLTVYLDVDADAGIKRKQDDERNRMEAEAIAFHRAVRAGYQELAREEVDRWVLLDGTLPVEELHGAILARVLGLLAEVGAG